MFPHAVPALVASGNENKSSSFQKIVSTYDPSSVPPPFLCLLLLNPFVAFPLPVFNPTLLDVLLSKSPPPSAVNVSLFVTELSLREVGLDLAMCGGGKLCASAVCLKCRNYRLTFVPRLGLARG